MKFYILIAMIIVFFQKIHAQDVIFQPYYSVAFPTDQFKETMPQNTLGIGWGILFGVSLGYESSFFLGADLNYNIYGKTVIDDVEKRKVARQRYDPVTETYVTDSVLENVDLVINNNLLSPIIFLRWRPQWKTKLVPYMEILGGGTYFYTRSKLRADAFKQINKNTYASNLTYTYGASAGINIMLGKGFGIDISAKHLQGGIVKFVTKDDITVTIKTNPQGNQSTSFQYRTRSAPFTMLIANVGLVLYVE